MPYRNTGYRRDERLHGHTMTKARKSGKVRIIAGCWRSRTLEVPAVPGLRPSPDAVRETLFNWLNPRIHDSHCLDLFAGSGALGFEAASRGAASVVMVDSSLRAVEALRRNQDKLQASDRIRIVATTASRFLQQQQKKEAQQFDIVFLDPPFADDQLESICRLLQQRSLLAGDALVYIESPWHDRALPIPSSWHIIREKRCGMVKSTLVQT
jgi:16S rRNA (guanine966-N2)-methyltransferase